MRAQSDILFFIGLAMCCTAILVHAHVPADWAVMLVGSVLVALGLIP